MGVFIRVVGALGSLVFGGLLVFFGYFGASFKQTPAVWGMEEIILVAAGVVVATAGLAFSIRPCRFTFYGAVGSVAAVLLTAGQV